jgi:D-3-phosphoglycerate dehydrogenase
MKTILIATQKPFATMAINKIKTIINNADYKLELLEKYTSKQELIDAVSLIDAAIIRSDIFDTAVFNAAKNLKIVVRAGAGYDNIDLNAASKNNIVVMNTPGQNSNAVAEMTIGFMIMMVRNQYTPTSGTELRDKTLGIHAYGNVGKRVAELAKGFGMKILAFDPFVSPQTMTNNGITPVSKIEDLYSKSDIVSLHMPAKNETNKSINYNLLNLMPQHACLINTARKEVIDEVGLIKIMKERPDFKYYTDIAPDASIEIKEKFGNRFFSTPKKMGAQTSEANINAGIAAANQIINFFEKGDTTFQVNK